jgi:hypothetical protein
MRNDGTPPRFETVDIRFRNGATARGVKPSSYRWSVDDPRFGVGYAFDILKYQRAKP